MNPLESFEQLLDAEQRTAFTSLDSPLAIQAFLDRTPYSVENANRCPRSVLQDGVAHCLDGAVFAAAALRRLGYPPLLLDMFPDPGTDDDHVLAIYTRDGCYGAVAKSNFAGLRAREPIYRSLRELVMSYFEFFFNVHGDKTLRNYTRPINLSSFDHFNWLWEDTGVDQIERRLLSLKRTPLLTSAMVQSLAKMDPLTYQAGMLGVNPEGLYKPH
jgi:hypothetical protein